MNSISKLFNSFKTPTTGARGVDPFIADTIAELRAGDPSLRFAPAKRVRDDGKGFARINRHGIVYYVKKSYTILNPHSTDGQGLYFVKGADDDPTGVFFTEGFGVDEDAYREAVRAYLFACGVPRSELTMIGATAWPKTYERTPQNLQALEAAGVLLPHEGK